MGHTGDPPIPVPASSSITGGSRLAGGSVHLLAATPLLHGHSVNLPRLGFLLRAPHWMRPTCVNQKVISPQSLAQAGKRPGCEDLPKTRALHIPGLQATWPGVP